MHTDTLNLQELSETTYRHYCQMVSSPQQPITSFVEWQDLPEDIQRAWRATTNFVCLEGAKATQTPDGREHLLRQLIEITTIAIESPTSECSTSLRLLRPKNIYFTAKN
jgi:hypothetical protein